MGKDWDKLAIPQAWVHGGGFSKPGIGDRDRDWPAFTGGHPVFGNANPTCADCGGRLRGAKKCTCPQPHDHWKPLGPPRTGALDTRQPGDPNYTRTSVPLFDRAKVRHSSAESYGGSAHLEMQAWHKQWLEKCYAALVPGGVIKIFSATRTFHRLAAAMQEVGFALVPGESLEAWAYGSGFPKSLNISKALDAAGPALPEDVIRFQEQLRKAREALGLSRAAVSESVCGTPTGACWNWESGLRVPTGEHWDSLVKLLNLPADMEGMREAAERSVLGKGQAGLGKGSPALEGGYQPEYEVTAPSTEEAKRFEGYGTAYKPAWEPFLVGRKVAPSEEQTDPHGE